MTSASNLITRVAALIIDSSGPITRDFDLTIGAVVQSLKPWLFDHRTSNTSDSNDWAIDFSGLFEKFYLSYQTFENILLQNKWSFNWSY